jgi:GGDEF domain-containing protein
MTRKNASSGFYDRMRVFQDARVRNDVENVAADIRDGRAVVPDFEAIGHVPVVSRLLDIALPEADRRIAEKAKLLGENEKLSEMLLTDSLTGLLNEQGFEKRLDNWIDDQTDPDSRVFIAYLDLDGFKEINDIYGHEVGDQLLVLVADVLRACLRPQDIKARLHGDEFALAMFESSVMFDNGRGSKPDLNSSELAGLMERVLIERLHENNFSNSLANELAGLGADIKLTVGVEVCTANILKDASICDILRTSDQRMLSRKAQKKAGIPTQAGTTER